MSIGWIVSKVEGKGLIDLALLPPTLFQVFLSFFLFKASRDDVYGLRK